MMRVFLCEHCKRWQYVSDRLMADCIACSESMFATKLMFTDFVDLTMDQRTDLLLAISEDMKDRQKHETLLRTVSRMLGRPVLENDKAICIENGYDY